MNNELISVVIPVYNTAKFLRKCLDSVINQSYKNLEIIIVNDASPDNSLEIINEYIATDNRIKVISNKINVGLSEARNLGINEATGQYITFIDSDDFISLDSIEILYNLLKENNVNVVIPQHILFDLKSKHFYKDNYYKNSHFIYEFSATNLVSKDNLFNNIIDVNVSQFKLYNLKIIKENNIHFPKDLLFEDNIFFYTFLLCDNSSNVLYTNNAIYYYTQNNSDSITRSNKKFKDIIKINKLVKDLFIKHNLFYSEYSNSINYYMCNHILVWGLTGRNNSLNKDIEYFKEASDFIKQEIDDNYLKTLKQRHRSYYCKIKKIRNNYKNFYYKMLLKDIYKHSLLHKFIRFIKPIVRVISRVSIDKIIKVIVLLFKLLLKLIASTPKLTYKFYKN
ncbi:MAG: glycosyltransferase [Alphaproteobacteria bacterium]|jgi:glycosyltransferase involved in cell wall biosynthesis|nr:glycosyltransferase [Alphaproteobacteria bacterium]